MAAPIRKPLVSVVLPTFNRRALLARAVDSVLRQRFDDFELLVVDDASTDGTAEFVTGLSDPRVRYLQQPANRGQAAARNAGIRAARADWVAFQDSDDEWLEDKLTGQMRVMRSSATAAMVYGDLLRIPAQGEAYVLHAPVLQRGRLFDDRPSCYATYGLGAQSCVIRRDVLLRLGGFEERIRSLEDMELFLRITRRFDSVRIPEPVCRYFETPGVSCNMDFQLASRRFMLRRYAWPLLRHRPRWTWGEIKAIRERRELAC